MNQKYTELGFKKPDFVKNEYGIKIYIGTTGKDNWDVEIPKALIGGDYAKYSNENFMFYAVTEEFALELAEKYTRKQRHEEMKPWMGCL